MDLLIKLLVETPALSLGLGLIVGALTGLVAGTLQWFLIEYLVRPEFENNGISKTVNGKIVSYRLKVGNKKKIRSAIDCVGTIEIKVEEKDIQPNIPPKLKSELENYKSFLNYQSEINLCLTSEKFSGVINENLCWAEIKNPARITINPKTSSYLDICKLDTEKKQLCFPSERGWLMPRMILNLKKYEFDITISAKNALPETKKFKYELLPTVNDAEIKIRKS